MPSETNALRVKKILAFSGSNNSESIHTQLLTYIKNKYSSEDISIDVRDVRDFETPYISATLLEGVKPGAVERFIELVSQYDAFIIASPEYNAGMPAIFKNLLDWVSKTTENLFQGKAVMTLAVSPGPGGGAGNLKYLRKILGYLGVNNVSDYSLPSFYDNMNQGVLDENQEKDLDTAITTLLSHM